MTNDRPTHHRVGDEAELDIAGLTEVTVLGSGGSSTVYRARQQALARAVAVKVVHGAWNIDTRERFEREREVMGRLSGHAATVPVFETGITRRGEPYLIMPLYQRGSLFRLMKDRGPLPWREATHILETLAQALADCHHAGIVHRDLKPGNILLTDNLQPRLADFGITLASGTPTSGSVVAYTPSYSPPEAYQAGTAEATTDVYSLGATLWALLAGRAPFTEVGEPTDVDAILERSIDQDLGPPTGQTPAALVEVIDRSMDKDPGRRPADAGVFAAELRRAARIAEQGDGRRSDDDSAGRGGERGRGEGRFRERGQERVRGRGDRKDIVTTAAIAGLIGVGLLLIAASVALVLFES